MVCLHFPRPSLVLYYTCLHISLSADKMTLIFLIKIPWKMCQPQISQPSNWSGVLIFTIGLSWIIIRLSIFHGILVKDWRVSSSSDGQIHKYKYKVHSYFIWLSIYFGKTQFHLIQIIKGIELFASHHQQTGVHM